MSSAARKKRITAWSTLTIWTGIPAWICISPAPARIAPNRSAAKRMPTGCDRPEQGDRDGVEADGGAVGGRHVMPTCAQDLGRAGQPGQQAADRHRQDDQQTRLHAGVAGRVRVGADGADLEAERGAEEQPGR